MKEFTVEFYDNKNFLITTYVILEQNIQQAWELAKKEAYHLIDIGECVPFTVSVLNNDDHLVYKTMTKKRKGITNMKEYTIQNDIKNIDEYIETCINDEEIDYLKSIKKALKEKQHE